MVARLTFNLSERLHCHLIRALGASMRMSRFIIAVATVLLFQTDAYADNTLEQRFSFASAVLQVRVVESTHHPSSIRGDPKAIQLTAKLFVLRSWKGAFPAGTTITATTATQQVCTGICPPPYPLQMGQELVIFLVDTMEPVRVYSGFVVDASQSTVRALDALAAKPLTSLKSFNQTSNFCAVTCRLIQALARDSAVRTEQCGFEIIQ
jgi:hypothetical protein